MTENSVFPNCIDNCYKASENSRDMTRYNQKIMTSNCASTTHALFLSEVLHNFCNYLRVTLRLQTNQSLFIEHYLVPNTIEFTKSNEMHHISMLQFNSHLLNFIKAP